MDRNITYFILLFNAGMAIYFFIKKNCEIPLFLALFNIFVEYRLVSLKAGYSDWVDFDYVIPFKFNFDIAYQVSDLILLGTSVMMYCFMFFFRPPAAKANDTNDLLYEFILSRKKAILYGLLFFGALATALKGSSGGYAVLTKLGTTSFIIFFFLLIVADADKKADVKLFYIILFVALALLTYDTALRFQFLGWMICIGFYLARNIKPAKKTVLSIGGIFLILVVFSAAGVLRYKKLSDVTLSSLYKESLDRLKIADDINFIDGFMMMYQVYPEQLPYGYGREHLNVILRPIPRALWPAKPLSNWIRNVEVRHGWIDEDSAGFSPTLWGVFYAEGGTYGVVLCSIIWAWFLARLYRAFSYFSSDLTSFLIGILLVCMIPIFRSGDLAGDVAIVLMSFWPMIIFVVLYKRFLKTHLTEAQQKTETRSLAG